MNKGIGVKGGQLEKEITRERTRMNEHKGIQKQ